MTCQQKIPKNLLLQQKLCIGYWYLIEKYLILSAIKKIYLFMTVFWLVNCLFQEIYKLYDS